MGYCYIISHKYNQHKFYVGSTINNKERERNHRNNCHNSNIKAYYLPLYEYVRKYGGIEQWEMTVIYIGLEYELFEKNYIKSTWEYNLNKEIPLQTKQEKKDRKQAKRKVYRVANREKINAKQKANSKDKIPCDNCGAIVSKRNLAAHKRTLKCRNFKS